MPRYRPAIRAALPKTGCERPKRGPHMEPGSSPADTARLAMLDATKKAGFAVSGGPAITRSLTAVLMHP